MEREILIQKKNITIHTWVPSYSIGNCWRITVEEIGIFEDILCDSIAIVDSETAKELALKMVRTKLADMLADVSE